MQISMLGVSATVMKYDKMKNQLCLVFLIYVTIDGQAIMSSTKWNSHMTASEQVKHDKGGSANTATQACQGKIDPANNFHKLSNSSLTVDIFLVHGIKPRNYPIPASPLAT